MANIPSSTTSNLLIPLRGISRDQYGRVRTPNTSRVLIPTVGDPPFRGGRYRDQYVRATGCVLIPTAGSVPTHRKGNETMAHVEIYTGTDGDFYFRFVAENGEEITRSSEGYADKRDAIRAIELAHGANFELKDQTVDVTAGIVDGEVGS